MKNYTYDVTDDGHIINFRLAGVEADLRYYNPDKVDVSTKYIMSKDVINQRFASMVAAGASPKTASEFEARQDRMVASGEYLRMPRPICPDFAENETNVTHFLGWTYPPEATK